MKYGSNYFKLSVISCSYGWIIIFVLCPLLLILGISLSSQEYGILPFRFFISLNNGHLDFSPHFSNYVSILKDPIYYKALLNSIIRALKTTFFCLIISYPIAYSIFTLPKRFKAFFLLLVIMPFFTSLLIRIYSWIVIFQKNGVINNLLTYFNIIDSPLNLLNTEAAVIIVMVYTYMPFMVISIFSSLEKIEISLLEAAADLGCKPFNVFFSIIFPMSHSGIITGMFLVFIPTLGELMIPELLGGVNVISIGKVIWTDFFFNRDWVAASATSIILLVVIAAPLIIIKKFAVSKI